MLYCLLYLVINSNYEDVDHGVGDSGSTYCVGSRMVFLESKQQHRHLSPNFAKCYSNTEYTSCLLWRYYGAHR